MATSIRLIRRYVWLVDTIRRAGSITLQDINRKWAYNTSLNIDNDDEIPERTFHRHREAIAELFDIEIGCNRFDGNKYYIKNEEALETPSFTTWLFNGLSIDNQILANRDVAASIIFEDTPGGNEFISPIIDAIANHRILVLNYQRFNSTDIREKHIEPYGLKQSGRRWYLVGKTRGKDRLSVLALDRIKSVNVSEDTFESDKTIDVPTYFDEVIGVNVDDEYDSETVTLRVYGNQRAYIDSLPLHRSQKILYRTSAYTDYEFTLRPEWQFQREILRLGRDAEILTPSWLRDEIRWQADEILKRYSACPATPDPPATPND